MRKATIGVIHSFRPPYKLLEKLGKGLCLDSETNIPGNLGLVGDCKTNLSQKPESSGKLMVSGKRLCLRPRKDFWKRFVSLSRNKLFPETLVRFGETNVFQKGYSLTNSKDSKGFWET